MDEWTGRWAGWVYLDVDVILRFGEGIRCGLED